MKISYAIAAVIALVSLGHVNIDTRTNGNPVVISGSVHVAELEPESKEFEKELQKQLA